MDETYHSRNGAISESLHVFIKHGLQRVSFAELDILEVGFGTGLNVLLTCISCLDGKQKIRYTSIEPYPLPFSLIDKLEYPKHLEHEQGLDYQRRLHQANWNESVQIHPLFQLTKLDKKLEELQLENKSFDLIYFDAFGPAKQAEMWTIDQFEKLYDSLKEGGILTTYAAAGQLKRNLKSIGFHLEHPPGANGKREMTVAIKPKLK
ncbi:MAG: tRNA (5-methylaminomethyl-2-thiouridine)(34)-methyltransferase MnmD [Bacteroidia bacterium]